MRSVLEQGHQLDLYSYTTMEGVPDGVRLCDAGDILPASSVKRHRSGSVSLFSNRFRYELQRRGLGTWVDCDVYLVRPLDETSNYLMGEEQDGMISGAILRMPPDSPLLRPLLRIFDELWVMPWLSWRTKPLAYWRLLTTGKIGLAELPWGSAGPAALTWLTRSFGLAHLALPSEVFYPVAWQDADWIRDPGKKLEDAIGPATVSVHLWNERIKGYKDRAAPGGSVLAQLQDEGRK